MTSADGPDSADSVVSSVAAHRPYDVAVIMQ